MNEEGNFGVQEAIWLCVCTIIAKVFYTSPSAFASLVGSSAWYIILFAAIIASGSFALILVLLKRFPGLGLSEIYELALGRVVGFIFSAVLGAFLTFVLIQGISEFQEVLHLYVFRKSPDWYLLSAFIISVAVVSLLGLESLVRTAKIFSFFIVAGLITLLVLSFENYNISNLFPILGFGADYVLKYSLTRSSVYGEIIIIAIFAGALQGTKYVKKAGFGALIISGITITLTLLAIVLTFPFYIAQEITAPLYELSQMIDYGRFLQRVEPVFIFVLVITTLISCTAVFYTCVTIYCHIFRIRDKRPVIVALGIIVFCFTLIESNVAALFYAGINTIRNLGSIPCFVMPIIALLVALIRKKRGDTYENT